MKPFKLPNSIAYLRIRHVFAALGLCIFMVSLSYYFQNGYLDIGEDKYWIFMKTMKIIVPGWLILRIIDFVWLREYRNMTAIICELKPHDYFLILFIISGGISTLTSQYRSTSLWGVSGWYMGYVTQLCMVCIYLMSADLFNVLGDRGRRLLLGVFFAIALPVILLGILNRFTIFPIHMFGEAEDFISTLGNINWFCGYWTIWTGVACGLFIIAEGKRKKLLTGFVVYIFAMAGVCCGASSCYLAWMAISWAALLVALDNRGYLIRFFYMQVLAFCTLPLIRIIGWIRPYRMWYDSAWLKCVTYGYAWIIPFAIGVFICLLAIAVIKRVDYDYSELRGICIGIPVGIVFIYFILMYLNTYIPGGIWPARGHSFMYWNNSWGNGRGAIWSSSVQMLFDMPSVSLFFGIGCDCMCAFAYSYTSMIHRLYSLLGNQYLTNAHNELLTMLINQGVFGLVVYAGLQVSHAKRAIDNLISRPLNLAMLLAMSGYMAIGLVGFMHILSTPFFFLVMGLISGLNAKDT